MMPLTTIVCVLWISPDRFLSGRFFLKEGLEPLEFEWLAHEISEDILMNRMEWELSLRETMDQLHFRIINQEKSFEVFSGTGGRLYFGADDHRAAAWVLLKILFPLNY
mgnify:CR=1 FL=1